MALTDPVLDAHCGATRRPPPAHRAVGRRHPRCLWAPYGHLHGPADLRRRDRPPRPPPPSPMPALPPRLSRSFPRCTAAITLVGKLRHRRLRDGPHAGLSHPEDTSKRAISATAPTASRSGPRRSSSAVRLSPPASAVRSSSAPRPRHAVGGATLGCGIEPRGRQSHLHDADRLCDRPDDGAGAQPRQHCEASTARPVPPPRQRRLLPHRTSPMSRSRSAGAFAAAPKKPPADGRAIACGSSSPR